MQELSDTWRCHARRYVREAKDLKKRAAQCRDVSARYQASKDFEHCLENLRNAHEIFRQIQRDKRAVWSEYLNEA